MKLKQSPSQTIGPFFAYGLTPQQFGYTYQSIADGTLAGQETEGEPIRLTGRVLDGEGAPIPDAMIEIWQANGHGRYNHPTDDRTDNYLDPEFSGFGRMGTGVEGDYCFETIKPGTIGDGQAPHVTLTIFMRGILSHVYARVYFSDEEEVNATDPVLSLVPQDRRDTLIAQRKESDGVVTYRLDIHMQGDRETVFFDL